MELLPLSCAEPKHPAKMVTDDTSGNVSSCATAPREVVTIAEAIERTLAFRPALLASAHQKRAAEGRVFQAGKLSNPSLFTEWENFGGSGQLSGYRALESTIGLSQEIPLGGKLKARHSLAQRELRTTIVEGKVRQLEMRALVAARFVRVFFLQKFCQLEEENLALAKATADAVSKRVTAGDALQLEKTRAEVETASSRSLLGRLRRELAGANAQLAGLWGGHAGGHACGVGQLILGDFEHFPPIPDTSEVLAIIAEHPMLTVLRDRVAAERAAVSVARAEGSPDLEISAGTRRFRETGDRGYIVGVSIGLPIFNRNRGELKSRRESVAVAELQDQEGQLAAREQLMNTFEKLHGVREGLEISRETILPAAQETFLATERGYQVGELGLLDLLDAQRTLLAARRSQLEQLREAYELFSELEFWIPGIMGNR